MGAESLKDFISKHKKDVIDHIEIRDEIANWKR